MKHIKKCLILAVAGLPLLNSCSDSWLEPKPLSIYTPENTYVDADGLYAALVACERNMRHEFFGDGAPITTDMYTTDLAVTGTTDKSGPLIDMDADLLPSRTANDVNKNKIGWYWDEGFKGIKYANIVLNRMKNATFKDEAEENAVRGAAYFQRAYRYYKLTHLFGDVPYLSQEIETPKVDFYTYDRWSILEQIEKDMEFAYQWVPEKVDRGKPSKWACGVLLMKVCMSLGHFDRAIEIGKEVIAANPLMTERFTTNKTKPNTNLMHDLHSVEAKMDMSNTEGILYVVSYPEVEGRDRINTMRNATPYWANGSIKTPDGKTGMSIVPANEAKGTELDNDANVGRGIGTCRPTNYYQYDIWTEKEKNDLRGVYNRDSWKGVFDLYYNAPALKGTEWYGKHQVKPVGMSVSDSIRCWFQWPHYKTFVPDPSVTTDRRGGETPWYIYRSAEVYLMLAECYYWKDMKQEAANMMNVVRQRAGAESLAASDINIGTVLDERARELYYEENRHVELSRISYVYALTGKACEVFGGHVYKLDNFSGPKGTSVNCKDAGVNFYFDWVSAKNNFYNKGIKTNYAEYRFSTHHVLWPIPEGSITSNTGGVINQNVGYPGTENNITPLKVGQEVPSESAQ